MRIAIYARLSRAQDDTLGVDRQVELCRARAEHEGWTVAHEFADDGKSGWAPTVRRPGYGALLEAVARHEVDRVLAYNIDRLFRQDKERARFYDIYTAAGLNHVAYVDGQDADLTTADGRKAFRDAGSGAEWFSDRQSERLRRKHDELARHGRWQGGGRRPFGYDVVGPKPYRLKINRKEAHLIRQAARHVLKGGTLHRLVVDWNAAGVRTPSGNRWTLTDVRRILLSPQVAAIRVHGRWEQVNGTKRRVILGEYEAEWEPIMSREEHELLKVTLNDPARRPYAGSRQASTGRRHPLTGLLVCGECGQKLAGKRRPGGKGRAYACTSAQAGCGRVAIVAQSFEEWVVRETVRHVIEQIRKGRRGRKVTKTPEPVADSGPLLAELREVVARVEQLAVDYADGALTAAQVQVATDRLEARRKELSDQLAAGIPPAEPVPEVLTGDIITVEELYELLGSDHLARMEEAGLDVDRLRGKGGDFRKRWRAGELTPSEVTQVHDFLAAHVEHVTVARAAKVGTRFDPKRATVHWR